MNSASTNFKTNRQSDANPSVLVPGLKGWHKATEINSN